MINTCGRHVKPFDFFPRTRVVFGEGGLARLGDLADELGFTRTLIVADQGLVETGHAARAAAHLDRAGIASVGFHNFDANPDTQMVGYGCRAAAEASIDSI